MVIKSNSNQLNNSKDKDKLSKLWYRLNNEPVYDIEEVLLHDIGASQYMI